MELSDKIKRFYRDSFIGEALYAHEDFEPVIDKLNYFAFGEDLKIHVVSSFRRPSDKLIDTLVQPSKLSNHWIGHAVDINLFAKDLGFFNSKRMSLKFMKSSDCPERIYNFLCELREDEVIRWGGQFLHPDEPHVDDAVNRRDIKTYRRKFEEIHGKSLRVREVMK